MPTRTPLRLPSPRTPLPLPSPACGDILPSNDVTHGENVTPRCTGTPLVDVNVATPLPNETCSPRGEMSPSRCDTPFGNDVTPLRDDMSPPLDDQDQSQGPEHHDKVSLPLPLLLSLPSTTTDDVPNATVSSASLASKTTMRLSSSSSSLIASGDMMNAIFYPLIHIYCPF